MGPLALHRRTRRHAASGSVSFTTTHARRHLASRYISPGRGEIFLLLHDSGFHLRSGKTACARAWTPAPPFPIHMRSSCLGRAALAHASRERGRRDRYLLVAKPGMHMGKGKGPSRPLHPGGPSTFPILSSCKLSSSFTEGNQKPKVLWKARSLCC